MATGKVLFSLLLVCALASAANTPLQSFVAPYLYAGENASLAVSTPLNATGSFVLVSVGGVDAFLLNQSGSGANVSYAFVNNSDVIYRALREHFSRTTEPTDAELQALLADIHAYNASRQPREAECEASTGLDRPDASCTADRCEACMSVPFCSDKIPYFGSDFLLSISQFKSATDTIDESIHGAVEAVEEVQEGGAPAALLALVPGNLSRANTAAQTLGTNHMFGCYSISGASSIPVGLEWCAYREGFRTGTQWCKDIPFNSSALSAASAKAAALTGRVVSNASARARADALLASLSARASYLKMTQENASFAEFYSRIEARASSSRNSARRVLENVSDAQLSRDLTTLSELLLKVSQYCLDHNYSAANATANAVSVLSAKIDNETAADAGEFGSVIDANASASLSIFRARLSLGAQDAALQVKLARALAAQEAIWGALLIGKPFAVSDLAEFRADLAEVASDADAVTAEKAGLEARQAGAWIGGAARAVSVPLLDRFASVASIPQESREGYARAIPSLFIFLAGALAYLGCISMFVILWRSGKIRLNRVASFLWVTIFIFLFIIVGMVAATANSIVQREAGSSAYGLFFASLSASPSAAIVVNEDAADARSLAAMNACASQLSSRLAANGKSVETYRLRAGGCVFANGTAADPNACKGNSSTTPSFIFASGNGTTTSFNAYYAKRAEFAGDLSLYSPCLIASVFGANASS